MVKGHLLARKKEMSIVSLFGRDNASESFGGKLTFNLALLPENSKNINL